MLAVKPAYPSRYAATCVTADRVPVCRPLASPDPFRQPASIRAIAKELAVTDAAVKQHLLHHYEKFGLDPAAENRRVLLANAAVLRGVLNADELRRAPST
jgi:hypothetical protein